MHVDRTFPVFPLSRIRAYTWYSTHEGQFHPISTIRPMHLRRRAVKTHGRQRIYRNKLHSAHCRT